MTQIPNWLPYALGSAFFAAATAILGKLGVSDINSNLATFIRTVVILAVTAVIVTVRHQWPPGRISGFGLSMLILSGIATGLSWLCYYRALQLGDASRVAPIDKLSVALVILFSVLFLGEPVTWRLIAGGGAIITGVILLAM